MRYLLAALGVLCVIAGAIGIFLPLLPTTPFLLLAAALFVRSSERLHKWLITHRILGKYISAFLSDRAIPLRVKIISISLMWTALLHTIFFIPKTWLILLCCAIGIAVSAYILSFKTMKNTAWIPRSGASWYVPFLLSLPKRMLQ